MWWILCFLPLTWPTHALWFIIIIKAAHSCSPPPAQSTTHSTTSSPGSAAAGMWSTCTACCGPQWRSTCSACSWESSLPPSLGRTKIWWGVKKRESVCLEVKLKVLFGVKTENSKTECLKVQLREIKSCSALMQTFYYTHVVTVSYYRPHKVIWKHLFPACVISRVCHQSTLHWSMSFSFLLCYFT